LTPGGGDLSMHCYQGGKATMLPVSRRGILAGSAVTLAGAAHAQTTTVSETVSSSPASADAILSVQALLEAARTNAPNLKDLMLRTLPGLRNAAAGTPPAMPKMSPGTTTPPPQAARDVAAVWGQDFLFTVASDKSPTISVDRQPPEPMTRVPDSNFWFKRATLRLGTTHNYNYFVDGASIGAGDVAAYNPDSYPLPGARPGTLSPMRTLPSTIYPGMTANYWVYANAGIDTTRGAPLMVWQDGNNIAPQQDLLQLRLQIVSDNLVHRKLIPPMVHVLVAPGSGGEATGSAMRSIQYDTVSDRYGRYLLQEVLPDVEKTYKLRQDAYSRAISGLSSGAIAAFNAAWYFPDKFSRVLSHIGSYTALQWHPEQHLDGGYIVSCNVRRDSKRNIRVWMSDGENDIESDVNPRELTAGSWPLSNIQLANALKLRDYDFHFRFGVGMHSIAQGALDLPESLAWLWREYDPQRTEQTYEMEATERAKPIFRVTIQNRDSW
jgi:enterochelin esterase family protein